MAEHNELTQEIIDEIFGEQPGLSFLAHLGKSGVGDNLQDFFRSRTGLFENRFRQAVGQRLLGGDTTALTPNDFFGGINFQQEAGKFSPETLGLGTSRFRPGQSFDFLRR